jgi:hypothetical protein
VLRPYIKGEDIRSSCGQHGELRAEKAGKFVGKRTEFGEEGVT